MASITSDQAIMNILKTFYVDGIQNLLFRNDPAIKEIGKMRVEGKEQAFAAIYSQGGAVSPRATIAEKKAKENVKNAEFKVTPGKLFSLFAYTIPEVQASLSRKGAYMKVAGNKAFAAAEAARKSLAAAFYGRGFGELGVLPEAVTFTANTAAVVELPYDVIVKIAPGSGIDVKASVAATSALVTLDVEAIDGQSVTVVPRSAYTAVGGEVLALEGSFDSSGGLAPMGLAGWIPAVAQRAGSDWTNYISTPFFNVTRSVNTEALAGNFYNGIGKTEADGATAQKKSTTIQNAMNLARMRGSEMDMIILNNFDWLELAAEIQSTNTYFTQTTTKAQRKANIGLTKLSAGFSTNAIEVIYDTPYLSKGLFYVLDKSQVEFWAYTNSDVATSDGVSENNPGKQDPEEFNDKGNENSPFKLLIDDILTVVPGGLTDDGESVRCTYNIMGSYVVLDSSVQVVGLFADADPDKIVQLK